MTSLSDATIWTAILLAGAGTQAIRWSFVLAVSRETRLPDAVMRALRLIPSAVLAAIVIPTLVRPGGSFEVPWANLRLLAALVAALVAWRTRNVVATIVTGMGVLWLLTWLT
ncbi:MAG: AzlD domain-containing protein [Acidimicrobiia bacterium]|nr:AzlD domain-containing protein [Acidimicrobiia bacterium]